LDKHSILPTTKNKEPGFFYGYIVVASAFLIMVITWGTSYTFGVFFKPLLEEFGWTRAMTSGAFSLSLIFLSLFSVVAGRLTDKFGPRIVVTVCGFLLGAGYLLVSQVSTIWQLYLFYGVIIGMGMSSAFVPLVSTVARWFVKRRGMMTGIAASGLGVGTLIMPPIANWLISSYGWRISYMVVGVTSLILIVLTAQLLRRDPGQIGQSPYGEAELKGGGYSQPVGFSLQGAIHTRQFWMLGLAILSFGLSLGTVVVHIVPHAIELGVSTARATVILAVVGGLSTVGRLVMGGTGDRIGNRLSLTICYILISISLFWLLAAKELWTLYLFAVIFGFGYGGISALLSLIVSELFGLSSHGAILGVITIFVESGSAIGPVLAGHIFDVTGKYQPAFLVFSVISVIGIMLAWLLKPTREKALT
jgi:MFS family permease